MDERAKLEAKWAEEERTERAWAESQKLEPDARRLADKLASWFKAGVVDGYAGNPRPITPATEGVQGNIGPRPYTDDAYATGFRLGEAARAGKEGG